MLGVRPWMTPFADSFRQHLLLDVSDEPFLQQRGDDQFLTSLLVWPVCLPPAKKTSRLAGVCWAETVTRTRAIDRCWPEGRAERVVYCRSA